MKLFSYIGNLVWSAVKQATTFVWEKALEPAARWVGRGLGISRPRIDAALELVEIAARKTVSVLETDLGPLVREVLNQAQLAFEAWVSSLSETWGAIARAAIARIEEALGLRREVEDVELIEIQPVRVERRTAITLAARNGGKSGRGSS